MLRRLHLLLFFAVAVTLLSGCEDRQTPIKVDSANQAQINSEVERGQSQGGVLKLGIGSMITPKEGYVYYRRLADYLEKKLGLSVVIVDRGTYREVNNLLATHALDMAFVCGGPYVEGERDFSLQLLVAPRTLSGQTVYHSYLIVPRDSEAESLADLRGKRFAFTDPQSNSGSLVPTYMLARLGEKPESFFRQLVYTHAHDKSIKAVAGGAVDGAAVDSLIYDYLAVAEPETVARVRIIETSDPYGIPPVVIRPGLSAALQQRLRSILLQMHRDPEGESILKGMMVERFVTLDNSAYDNIRRIADFVRDFNQR